MTLDSNEIIEIENPDGKARRWICDFDYAAPVGFPRCWIVEVLWDGRRVIEELETDTIRD